MYRKGEEELEGKKNPFPKCDTSKKGKIEREREESSYRARDEIRWEEIRGKKTVYPVRTSIPVSAHVRTA